MTKKPEEKDPDSLARAMYEVYTEVLNVNTSVPLPSWLQLEDLHKNAWRVVAKGVAP